MIVNDAFDAVHPIVAGLDVHKMQITATVRRLRPDAQPGVETRTFSALPSGIDDLVAWLQASDVQATLMESAGIYWLTPFQTFEAANLRPKLVHAHKVKQIKGHKTDFADSRWLARVCQYGLTTPSYVPRPIFVNCARSVGIDARPFKFAAAVRTAFTRSWIATASRSGAS